MADMWKRDSGFEALANAIIIQAARDYTERKSQKKSTDELKLFFKSGWCEMLSRGLSGTYILRKLDAKLQ